MVLEKYDLFAKLPTGFIKTLLSISGNWPLLPPFQMYFKTFVFNVCHIALYVIQITGIISTKHTTEVFLQLVAYLSTTTCLLIVYYTGRFNIDMGLTYMNKIIIDCWDFQGTKEYDIIFKYATFSRIYIMTLLTSYVAYICSMFLYMCIPVLLDMIIPLNETRARTLIFPMDWINGNEKHFIKLLILQCVLLLLLGVNGIGALSAYLIILQHLCAMFQVVGSLLDDIFEEKEKQPRVTDDHAVYHKIIRIIGFHNRTIECMDDLNAKFNMAYLAVVACALTFIGICVIQLLREKEESRLSLESLRIIFYIIFHLIWVFLFCYIGQHLMDTSMLVSDKIYGTPWYSMSKRSQRLLLFMIARTSKPLAISIGRMFTATHEFFTGLVRLSISFATVFSSLQ